MIVQYRRPVSGWASQAQKLSAAASSRCGPACEGHAAQPDLPAFCDLLSQAPLDQTQLVRKQPAVAGE